MSGIGTSRDGQGRTRTGGPGGQSGQGGRGTGESRVQSPESRVQNCGAVRPKACAEAIKAAGFAGCGLRKCPFRKSDRDRIAWDGKIKGDTIRRANREVNGRKVWAVMPPGAFYLEDTLDQRVIYAGEGIGGQGSGVGGGRFMVLYRKMNAAGGSHRLRIKDPTDNTYKTYSTNSQALTALWLWVRNQQTPYMRVVEGEIDLD